ncbi:MAG: hypothetical protein KDA53_04210 [Hyphomonas sp.]|nr:hypothetical protein [Hyphomonas sp.]
MRSALAATTAFTCLPAEAEAHKPHVFAEASVSSAVLDRGEQIGAETLELAAGFEMPAGGVDLFASVYRLTPLGAGHAAFDEEVDYTLGMVRVSRGYTVSVAASWLTYPGEGEDPSLEWSGEVIFDLPLGPTVAGFYDADSGDRGAEFLAGPEWTAGDWTLFATGRVGLVSPGDGSADRSYAGLEASAIRPVSEAAELALFVRADAADEDSFAGRIEAGEVHGYRATGIAAGIGLSIVR